LDDGIDQYTRRQNLEGVLVTQDEDVAGTVVKIGKFVGANVKKVTSQLRTDQLRN